MTTYKSKIGPELLIPISILLVGTGILMAYERAWLGLAVVLLVVAFITHMFVTTYYHIDNRTLKIRCGFFYDKTINIDTIEEVKKTRSAVSSPAASLDRIMIRYNKTDTVIISPGNKETFMSHLTRINPRIKVG